ncbi:MAG TPA: hypothetical protein VMV18_14945, partial [bacterium]|nr:hypothetical protein [bacterium]
MFSETKHTRRAAIVAGLLATAIAGCKIRTENSADAATPPPAGTSAIASAGKGDYAGISTGKVDKGDVSVLLPEVGTLAPVTKVDVK